jgi:CRP-like cAMP-binding protein
MNNNLTKVLESNQFLRGIDPVQVAKIASIAELCEFGPGAIVFREGQNADNVYLVVSGKLSLGLSESTIYQKSLVTVGPGEMLGWSSMLENSHFAATAIVTEPAKLVRIDGARMRKICDDDPQLGYELMRRAMLAVSKRLKSTWAQLSHLYVSQYLPVTSCAEE